MRPAVTNKALRAPSDWQAMTHGDFLQQQISSAVEEWLPRLIGYYMLTLGPLAKGLDLSASSCRHQLTVHDQKDADLITHLHQLPFQTDSVDACVLPLCLDFSSDPHQMLREAHRIVIPDGHLLIAGCNPLSLLMLGKLSPSHRKVAPWNGRFFTSHRMKDWLQLLGCEVVAEQTTGYSSLMGKHTRHEGFHQFGQKFAPWAGSIYLILAKKREVPLTPIRPSWQTSRQMKPVNVLSGAGVAGRGFRQLRR
ncbi:methyltransferase domain-containing protein [Echinimonas agarilytica]|uniref:Class I SAM-dependent methyltransferase n=1 Tax=Echinimonas agarilytica TaxID=1215918 RepID=A0AA41W5Q7_9GAMM|nr:methyltransferase domain-containing protein [Echinimonas agarilytica]MCM2679519.1 class I SAM-dependent methyltransferase [Echinimonas agarilytica]